MRKSLLFIIIICILSIVAYLFYFYGDEIGFLSNIEFISNDIVPEEKQIEIVNADIDIRYFSNIVLNNLEREEYVITLYLADISKDEAPNISNNDIYAYLVFNNQQKFGSPEVSKFSEDKNKIAVSIVMDYSGTMAPNINDMQGAVKAFISNFSNEDMAEIIKFGTNIDHLSRFISDKNMLNNYLYSDSYIRGETSLFAAINDGIKDFASMGDSYLNAVVAFADGQDNYSNIYNVNFQSVVKNSLEKKIPIFTVGLQAKEIPQEYSDIFKKTLFELSQQSGGFNFMTKEPEKLTELYNRINISLRNSYIIKIKWNGDELPPSGTNATLHIRIMSGKKAIADVNKNIIVP